MSATTTTTATSTLATLPLATFEDVRDRFFPGTPVSYAENFTDNAVHDKLVVHIGARAGSTRIRDKNVRRLGGIPLIGYTILAARALGADRVILNTDSEEYCRIGEAFGAECPFIRPGELARPDVSPGLASYYAARKVLQEGYPAGYWVEMYPTSPFRNGATLRRYVEVLRGAGSCVAVNRITPPPGRVYAPGGRSVSLDRDQGLVFYKATGTFLGYALDADKRFWRHHEIIRNPVELIDIDTDRDWELAESILAAGAYDFGMELPC
ncbi:cytidylyltransferase domain-containing protein [Pseudodesulfovibrio indicus]|uniref:N-acylneuraminate cytidylyltransferase n=1 Tax=Pseudodesulfovibrio indicus TaxID=1716143 RepID=A0A126QKZ9_9BACT|nr:hypothetical protein [Pseudodesulfovibrio indicus]AMK10075.1 hypothetical protein AWY79_02560 [Pseudodesulfovibrio indicus]TDT86956.1 N-acylneuraminate cytidylyltransferase [Pseudodesulfovibrio indicus]